MQIGGKMYLADQARAAQSKGYRQEMNRQTVENNFATMQSLGQSIFATNATAGQEAASLFIQMAADRVNADVKARYEQLTANLGSLSGSTDRLA